MAILLGATTASSVAQLGHVSGWWHLSCRVFCALFFLWGIGFAVPFYIPPSLYALKEGGRESSATIADVFDCAGFAALAAFNCHVAGIPHHVAKAWIPTFTICTAMSILSLSALSIAVLRE